MTEEKAAYGAETAQKADSKADAAPKQRKPRQPRQAKKADAKPARQARRTTQKADAADNQQIRFTATITPETRRRLRVVAATLDIEVGEALTVLLDAYDAAQKSRK